MKNNKKLTAAIFAICLILILSVALTACKTEPQQLATPTVTISESGLASWATIENASGYAYKIDGGTEHSTTETSVQLTAGQSITVKAVGDGENYTDSEYSAASTYTVTTGLPTPATGFYIKDADIVQESDTVRYIVYTTNSQKGEEDNVIAIRKGTKIGNDWQYGNQTVALEGAPSGWDMYLGSASIAKGAFEMGDTNYNWIMAYQATDDENERAYSIGLAVAQNPEGPWVKVGTTAIISYDKTVYGNFTGCYAPSIVNYNKASGIRIFFTYADSYGHFAKYYDADMSDLDTINGSSAQQITNKGNLHGGDTELMFPNADFAYDSTSKKFIAVKDYSPAAATTPKYADRFELCEIAEEELYTTDQGTGWVSLGYWDCIDLENNAERAYSATLVSDAYGHLLSGDYEIVYNVCKTQADTADWAFTQSLMVYIATVD